MRTSAEGEDPASLPPGLPDPGVRVLLAVAIVAGCTLALQVVLTRLFSAVLPYHFTYLAISLAFLGTGAGALFVFLRPGTFQTMHPERALARWSALFAALLVTAPLLLVKVDFTYGQAVFRYDEPMSIRFVLHLAWACVLAGLPFFAAGVAIAIAIDRYTHRIGHVYAWDLGGAGLGALGIVPLLWVAPAPTLMVGLGVAAAVAAILAAGRRRAEGALAVAACVAALVTLGLARSGDTLRLPMGYNLPADAVQRAERWTPLGRVSGFELPGSPWAVVFFDRVYAPVAVITGGRDFNWRRLFTGPQSIGYEIAPPGRALIIGGGGGRDIHTALAAGRSEVHVIELNEAIRRIVDEDLAPLSLGPYSLPGVVTRIGDGRSVLMATADRYHHIHIGFTDTLSANSAGGLALLENNLYTLEAFEELLSRLEPGGILNISRLLKLVGDEALRVTVLALAALERRGVVEPARHVVVVLGRDLFGERFGTVLVRLEPFEPNQVEHIRALARERGDGIAFAPGGPYSDGFEALAGAPSLLAFCKGHPLDVCPPTDDRPFFFNMFRPGARPADTSGYVYAADPSAILLLTLAILAVLSLIAFLLPLRLAATARRPTLTSLTYFAAIGVGFLVLEIVLIQRFVLFLGFPTYALSVVLFALLLWTGVGSLLSTRLADPRRALLLALAAAAVLAAGGAYTLQPLLRSLIALPFAARVIVAIALLAPFGVALGMAMPLGLRRFKELHPQSAAYAWGVNGMASVLASVLAVAVALYFGFAAASLVAAACYLFAFGHAALGAWPARSPTAASIRGSAKAV